MEYQFEEFSPGPVEQNADRIHASINNRGNIHLNRQAFEALGEPERVVLLYDMRRSAIGISRATPSRPNGYKLRHKQKTGSFSRVIYAANFCRHYRIRPDGTLAFTDAKINKDGILVLSFHEVVKVRRK